jgi:hypothetical protein
MKIVLLVSFTVISFILIAQKIYPKIHINSSIMQKGADGKWETWVTHAVIDQKAFRISLTHQLTGKYHAGHIEKLDESKWQTITIVDNRRMDMNFNSSRQFLRWISRHGYETQYSERSGSTMNFTFKKIL